MRYNWCFTEKKNITFQDRLSICTNISDSNTNITYEYEYGKASHHLHVKKILWTSEIE